MDSSQISEAFSDVFDEALLFHGFADYARDYEAFIQRTASQRAGIRPRQLRYCFTCCVRATVTSALPPGVWKESLDERLLDREQSGAVDGGYVWGARWQNLYPGMRLVPDSADARRWSADLGLPFHEAAIQTNSHHISLVFSDLTVADVQPGHAPFTVPAGS